LLRKHAICAATDLLKDVLLVWYTVQEPTCVVGWLVVRMWSHCVSLYVHASIVICTVLERNLWGLDSICLLIDCRSTQMGAWWQGCTSMWARCGNDCTWQHAVARGNHAPLRVHLYVHASIVICTVLARNLRGLDSICLLIDCRSTQMGAWCQGCASMWARCGNDCTWQQAVAHGSHAPLRIYLIITFVHLSAKRNSGWDWSLLSGQCTCNCNAPEVAMHLGCKQ